MEDITLLDHIISQHGHKTVAYERLPSVLQHAKTEPLPTIPDLQREIGRLRYEVIFHKERHESLIKLFSDVRIIYRLIEDSLQTAAQQHRLHDAFMAISSASQQAALLIQGSLRYTSDRLAASEEQLLDSYGISLDDTHANDYSVL
ncbi:uncharacterized protein BDV17DRAFT_270972 [Aspergillus undulatus]|uniref:uncharacterized protein n=1 Tax=Aspergillus undulatus TaxID=1810928 RepID=UPI003CCC94C4